MAGTDIDRIVDGKTVECWAHVDQLGLLQQLGAASSAGRKAVAHPSPNDKEQA